MPRYAVITTLDNAWVVKSSNLGACTERRDDLTASGVPSALVQVLAWEDEPNPLAIPMTTEEAMACLRDMAALMEREQHKYPLEAHQFGQADADELREVAAAFADATARAERAEAASRFAAGNAYRGIASTLQTIASRIGVAADPKWIREQIEREASKYATWAKAANLDAPATGEERG